MANADTERSHECAACGADVLPGDDFCRACGHSIGFGEALAGGDFGEDDNAGVICPSCGATHMVRTSSGRFVCETCDYVL